MGSLNIPTTQEIADMLIAAIEQVTNQKVPLNPKAFSRAWSAAGAMFYKGMYLYGVDRAEQNFIRTCNLEKLKEEGPSYGVDFKNETSTVLSLTVEASTGISIDSASSFVGDDNGVLYTVDALATEAGGVITVSVTAENPGVIGNLIVGNTLTIDREVAGASRFAKVAAITTTGTNDEDTEVYRGRIQFEIRTAGGGGNSADYKRWGEKTPGIARIDPYSGSVPGERDIYCEAQTDIDPDGIPTAALLSDVRDYINTNQDTGKDNTQLGFTDDTLNVYPITRPAFGLTIYGLVVASQYLTQAKAQLDTDVDRHFRALRPFVDGIDPSNERIDRITAVTLSGVVRGVLKKYGGYAQRTVVTKSGSEVPEYGLGLGEMAKLGVISYA